MPKYIQHFLLAIIIFSSLFLGACKKENMDKTEVEEEEIPIDTTFCDLMVTISEDNSSGNDVLITNLTGGEAPFTFFWSDSSFLDMITPSADGDYAVTVTDNNGCTSETNYDYVSPDPCLSFTVEITEIVDSVNSMSELIANPSGGTMPFSYLWSEGSTTNNITVAFFSGTYTISVVDNMGCVVTDEIQL